MKLTDPEQVILKAIGSGVAEISRVIKAVGYPKATVKKVLVRLNEKGIVALHRHDYPQSLTPAQRKVMLRLKDGQGRWSYYNAVSMRKRNPKSKGKTALKTTGKALKSLAKGALSAGSQILGAGATALNPTKRKKRNKTIIKAKRVVVLNPKKKPAKKAVKRKRNRDYPYWNVYHVDTKKSPPYDKTFLGSSSFGMDKKEAIAKFRQSHYPGRLRAGTKIVAEKGVVTMNPKRQRNLDHKDSRHQVEVSKHWRAGGASQWQRAHRAGQKDLFGHGIKARNPEIIWQVDNYNKTAKSAAEEFARTYWQEQRKIRGLKPDGTFKVVGGIRTYRVRKDGRLFVIEVVAQNPRKRKVKRNASKSRTTKSVSKHRAGASRKTANRSRVRSVAKARKAPVKRASGNPTRKGMRKGYREAKRISKVTRGRYFSSESGQRKAARHEKRQTRKGKRNPSAESIRKEFAGSVNGERDLFFPQGTPAGKLAKLGKLVSITTEEGTIKPVSGAAWLCADTKGKLHIGSTSGAPLFDGPKRSFGHVTKLEYESTKPHLGYKGPIIWFHRAGEENGIRPTLHADGKGGIVFRGGDYRLTRRGIEN